MNFTPLLLLVVSVVACLSSCVSTREATYFNETGESSFPADVKVKSMEPIIQENDLLSISVSSLNPEASEIFNTPNMTVTQTSTVSGTIAQASGYLVDQDGLIQFPFLGNIQAAGLTKKTLRENIKNEIIDRKLLLDPIVNIRYLNYKVSVLGEVGNPSVLTIPNEKVTLLEALGLAGDLTIYAKRDNVLLIREEEGEKILKRIDLTTNEIFTSPYYYLKSNDIVYVEPNKSKIASTSRANQWLPVIISSLSLAVIALDRFVR